MLISRGASTTSISSAKAKTLKRGGGDYIYTPAIIGQYCQGKENIEARQKF